MGKKAVLRELAVEQLQRGRYQSRRQFDSVALEELAASIKEQGIIQPIVVRAIDDRYYEIIAGERRWRAAQLAGLHEVPCLVRVFTNEDAAEVSTIENVQREDLNSIEEAEAYQKLIDEFNYLHEEVAIAVGKSRAKISNSLRLLKLDARVQQCLIDKQLNEGQGKVLAALPHHLQFELAQKCIELSWSVRTLEQEVRKRRAGPAIQAMRDPDVARLERVTSEHFGSQVKLESDTQGGSGWLKIKFYNNETLAGILEKMGVDE